MAPFAEQVSFNFIRYHLSAVGFFLNSLSSVEKSFSESISGSIFSTFSYISFRVSKFTLRSLFHLKYILHTVRNIYIYIYVVGVLRHGFSM